MSAKVLVTAGTALAAVLWSVALTATIVASDGRDLDGMLFIGTQPIVTSTVAVLSIALIAWKLTRPMQAVSVMYAMGFRHGVRSVAGEVAEVKAPVSERKDARVLQMIPAQRKP